MEDSHHDRQSLRRNHHRYRCGGGTSPTPGASGKRILILERGDYVPREKAIGTAGRQCGRHYNAKESWLDKDGKDLHPHTTTTWAATPSFTVLLCSAAQEDFGELRHLRWDLARVALSYDDLEPYYTQAENLYQVHGNRGEIRRTPGTPPILARRSHEPRIQQLSTTSRARTEPSTCRSASCSMRRIRIKR